MNEGLVLVDFLLWVIYTLLQPGRVHLLFLSPAFSELSLLELGFERTVFLYGWFLAA